MGDQNKDIVAQLIQIRKELSNSGTGGGGSSPADYTLIIEAINGVVTSITQSTQEIKTAISKAETNIVMAIESLKPI